jgi:hypothetical protein
MAKKKKKKKRRKEDRKKESESQTVPETSPTLLIYGRKSCKILELQLRKFKATPRQKSIAMLLCLYFCGKAGLEL